jgi:hypothetical protein
LPLPATIKFLGLDLNIFELPPLPDSLFSLGLSNTPIRALPPLPDSLRILFLENTRISNLPPWPPGLKHLWLHSNDELRTLPTLPDGLVYLQIIEDHLLCLPIFPASMTEASVLEYCLLYEDNCDPENFDGYYNLMYSTNYSPGIPCFPNLPEGIGIHFDSWVLPVCEDPEYVCDVLAYARGKIFLDLDDDDLFTPGIDLALPGQAFKSLPSGRVIHSSTEGDYWVPLIIDTENTWSVSSPPQHAVAQPSLFSLTPTSTALQAGHYNFVFKPLPGVYDLESFIAGSVMRPGFATTVSARIRNLGTVDQSGIQVRLRIPEGWSIESADPLYSLVSGDTLIWENVELVRFTDLDFRVVLRLPPTAALLGTTAGYEVWAYSAETDVTPDDNYAAWQDIIRGSYDPNDKLVSPEDLSHLYTGEENILYTIRFQNTGTDTAFFVNIRDEFPENVDLSTLKLVNASHPCKFMILDKRVVEVFFDNILLPDSTTNEPASHGFVQFTVKPVPGLQIHDEIINTAAIYFDYNEPIITNEAITTVKILSSAGVSGTQKLDFQVYPNPSRSTIRVVFPEHGHGRWKLHDIVGRIVQEGGYSGHARELYLSVRELPSGIYVIILQAADGTTGMQKIVVTR